MRSLFAISVLVPVITLQAQNTCLTALPVGAGTHIITAVNGTQIPIPLCANTGSGATSAEWYTYTPAADHYVTINTDLAVNAGDDTRLHVYQGVCGNLTCIIGSDYNGWSQLAAASFNAQQGITYIFAFDNLWSSTGFTFELIEGPPIPQTVSFSTQGFSAASPFCVVDMNNDQRDDVVSAYQNSVVIKHQQAGGSFTTTTIPTTSADNPASWSIAAGDIDKNGQNDLLYGGGSGATFMKANANGTAFTEVSFPNYIFCQRTNFVDINSDGHLDAFVCHDVDANVRFMNDGSGNLTFNQGGLGQTCGNYGSIWTDHDNDGDVDLFIAKCGCDPVDMLHRNNGNGTFTEIASPLNLAGIQESWSSAWGDFDLDGDMDVLIGASSFASGGHKLMRNDGAVFTDVTAGSGFDIFNGTGIEHTTHDFDNDGLLDVLCANSTVMVNLGNMVFGPNVTNVAEGAIGDLNNDGYLDVLGWNGIHMNNGGTNHWLRINTVGTVSNGNGIGARVYCTSALGTQMRDVKSGDGFAHMSSLMTHFGLGQDTQVDEVVVRWPNGIINVVDNPAVDGTITIVEDPLTSIVEPLRELRLNVWPNPATDMLQVRGSVCAPGAQARLMDATGKQLASVRLGGPVLDVSHLSAGMYILEVVSEAGKATATFSK